MKRHRLLPKRLVRCGRQRRLLSGMLTSKTIASSLKAILYASCNSMWRGLVVTPPGSLLEAVVAEFKAQTPIPLELPFMSTVAMAAQYMAERGAMVVLNNNHRLGVANRSPTGSFVKRRKKLGGLRVRSKTLAVRQPSSNP